MSAYAVVIFAAERGAETMWPEVTPYTWWGIAGAVLVVWAAVEWWLWTRRAPASTNADLGTGISAPGRRMRLAGWPFRRGLLEYRRDEGRGDLAARLVETAPDFRQAVSIFNDCRHSVSPRRLDLLWDAMGERRHTEGLTPETWRFVMQEKDPFMRVDVSATMEGKEADEEREKQYIWMVMECVETWKGNG